MSRQRLRKPITVKVSPHLFGVGDASLVSLTRPGLGAIRVSALWHRVEPEPGVYDFARLDNIVELAHANHTAVLLILTGTPAWAEANVDATSTHDPPRLSAYRDFVTTLMKRYKDFDPENDGQGYRGIADYQVWNEPNIKTFWTGTLAQMAKMVHTVWQVRQQVDPGARVIAPSMVTRLRYEMHGVSTFYSLKVAHKPVWKFVDATTFSLYPRDVLPDGRPAGPEQMVGLLHAVRATLAEDHVSPRLPVWDSEINYGVPMGKNAGSPARAIPDSRQVAFVMRTYLLSAAAGVPRVFWYAYDVHDSNANTFLTEPPPAPPGTLTPAGEAFYRVQAWMHGTLVGTATKRPCARDDRGTYTCVVRYATGMGRIYWNPTHGVRVRTVKSARSWESEWGVVHKLSGRRLKVGSDPVLVRSER